MKAGEVKSEQFNEAINLFSYLDNKYIESYAYGLGHYSKDEANEKIDEAQLLHFMRHLLRELNYLLSLPVVLFWFELLKDNKLVEFFDTLLLNMRKSKDTYKL